MNLSLVVAVSENNVIGNKGEIPWRLSSDLKHFAELTRGNTVIMGRKTFESIVARLGKPLPDRTNVVITRQKNYSASGTTVVSSLDEALTHVKGRGFIIGGGELYREALPKCDTLFVTRVNAEVEGDTHFPPIDETRWKLTSSDFHPKDAKNEYDFTFQTYERIK